MAPVLKLRKGVCKRVLRGQFSDIDEATAVGILTYAFDVLKAPGLRLIVDAAVTHYEGQRAAAQAEDRRSDAGRQETLSILDELERVGTKENAIDVYIPSRSPQQMEASTADYLDVPLATVRKIFAGRFEGLEPGLVYSAFAYAIRMQKRNDLRDPLVAALRYFQLQVKVDAEAARAYERLFALTEGELAQLKALAGRRRLSRPPVEQRPMYYGRSAHEKLGLPLVVCRKVVAGNFEGIEIDDTLSVLEHVAKRDHHPTISPIVTKAVAFYAALFQTRAGEANEVDNVLEDAMAGLAALRDIARKGRRIPPRAELTPTQLDSQMSMAVRVQKGKRAAVLAGLFGGIDVDETIRVLDYAINVQHRYELADVVDQARDHYVALVATREAQRVQTSNSLAALVRLANGDVTTTTRLTKRLNRTELALCDKHPELPLAGITIQTGVRPHATVTILKGVPTDDVRWEDAIAVFDAVKPGVRNIVAWEGRVHAWTKFALPSDAAIVQVVSRRTGFAEWDVQAVLERDVTAHVMTVKAVLPQLAELGLPAQWRSGLSDYWYEQLNTHQPQLTIPFALEAQTLVSEPQSMASA